MERFEIQWRDKAQVVDNYLAEALFKITRRSSDKVKSSDSQGLLQLAEAMEYSILGGGKRFRPLLCLWTLGALGCDIKKGLPLAAAIELIHGYSLIHDDLPCMDDDDERRGRPTTHIVFGEATALLAGTTLTFEAIGWLAQNYEGDQLKKLVTLICEACGFAGMNGGQAIDINLANTDKKPSAETLDSLHNMKTGALIRASIEGAAIIAQADSEKLKALKEYGEHLGLAFQVADDILDFAQESAPNTAHLEYLKKYLEELTQKSLQALSAFGEKAWALENLARYNLNRKK